MASIPRRLRNLNNEEEVTENAQPNDEGVQGPPEIDNILPGIPHDSTVPVKIIWPNGETRHIVGVFRGQYLSQLKGGKIVVGTNQDGVPNERSGSILGSYLTELAENSTVAPLHIPRWYHEMFRPFQKKMIELVEGKFIYPPERKQLTQDWILKTLAKGLRAYKSRLKKKYYNRNNRTLEEILKDVPLGVDENQWQNIVGMWCQDSHTKLCLLNSECAKQKKNSHTTGRKGHARLLKEMETEKKGKVSRIELWDRAHKKKDGNYVSKNVKEIMDITNAELDKRKLANNGSISSKDYNDVSTNVLAKRVKLRGFYHDKHWNQVKVSQGMTFLGEPDQQGEDFQFALRVVGDNVEDVKDELQMLRAFITKKFPGEDYRNVMDDADNDEIDPHEGVDDKDIERESNNDIEEPTHNMDTSSNILQQLDRGKCTRSIEGYVNSAFLQECMITKDLAHKRVSSHLPEEKAHTENIAKQNQDCAGSSVPPEQVTSQKAHIENSTKANQGTAESSLPQNKLITKDQIPVLLFSANPRNQKKVVAKGTFMSYEKTYVVGGSMMGDQYFGVLVDSVPMNVDEKLPRPYENIHTIRQAIGHVIAWPRCLVKRPKKSSSNQPHLKLAN